MIGRLQIYAAEKGIKLSIAAIKAIAGVLLLIVISSLSWCTASRVAVIQAENASLKQYQADVLRREDLSAAAQEAFQTAQAEAALQDIARTEVVVIHDRATRDASNEDPATADFLNAPIPDRLRRADREARADRAR